MNLKIKMISSPKEICEIEQSWNERVGTISKKAPFFLSGFLRQFMDFQRSTGWDPLVLVFSVNERTVGVAPLKQKRFLGVPIVRYLYGPAYLPELIFDDANRKTCLKGMLDFLFRTLRCKLVDINLPAKSPDIPLLRQLCRNNGVYFSAGIWPELNHRVLATTSDWNAFETSRGGKFRRKFKKMERKLSQAGSNVVECVENPNESSNVFSKMLAVEKASWKEIWRSRKGDAVDPEIPILLKGSQKTAELEPEFTWKVWFLELNCRAIAYSVVLEYNRVVFISKISYDEAYKKFYPGIYLVNAIIRDSFMRGQIEKIDFLTDLPFMDTWDAARMSRVRLMMGKGLLPTVLEIGLNNTSFVKVRSAIGGLLVDKAPRVGSLDLLSAN